MTGKSFYFHNNWHFLLGNYFPIKSAIDNNLDKNGKPFYHVEYIEKDWREVTLPHTFNDVDLFRDRIKDAGSGQKRTTAFYRNWLYIPKERAGQKVILEFEGVRQTCYLYVNGVLAAYHENGVAPFGFDITDYVEHDKQNLIAVATDNTATRNIRFCCAETPNKEDVEPGSYLFEQDEQVNESQRGVGFFWNCNDFNPSVGGLTRPVKVHFKPKIYLTLPLYSNLKTKGTYVYGLDYDTKASSVKIAVVSEVRNESGSDVTAYISVKITDLDGAEITRFKSEEELVKRCEKIKAPLSIVPSDAYRREILSDGSVHYAPENDEKKVAPTDIKSVEAAKIKAVSERVELDFWSVEKPRLYKVEIELYVDGELKDTAVIETGFRKVGYDKDKGVMINDVPLWLRGYAQRASNEWAAIGIAPQWLKDYDMSLLKESNANFVRWMHVGAMPSDIRAMDRQGVVCAQPAGDKEQENFGRQWDQRVELMRDIIIFFRNSPSILFWEAGNNSINAEHMREMRLLKEALDPFGGRFMGCRTLNTEETVIESEYVGTMLNRHAARFIAEHGPITETEYLREESPRRVWDDFSPPDYDYKTKWVGNGGKKQEGFDFYDLTAEEFALAAARGYSEFFNDRIGGASGKDYYSAAAALCWTDSAQHGRQSYSENGRMSGRVDAARNKKQSFDVFRVMQSPSPALKIIGHWNYHDTDGKSYAYNEKRFNGEFWEETGEICYRNPKCKTVYVTASYHIARVELYINGMLRGECKKPQHTFIFAFENVDITEKGFIKAVGYDYNGEVSAADTIQTAQKAARLVLTPHTSPEGLKANGADVAYVDIAVTDEKGIICPLCYDRIDFELSGEGIFLGGYNSGLFDGYGKSSVIHKNYVYAECGTNRVFIRSTKKNGKITMNANMGGIKSQCHLESVFVNNDTLSEIDVSGLYGDTNADYRVKYDFPAISEADRIKYTPDKENYTKILVNGQEPDTRGVGSVNKNGRIWGAILCILPRIENIDYEYQADKKRLIIRGKNNIVVEAGKSHFLLNNEENLMDGEPYVTDRGQLVMEISAIAPFIDGVTAWYDDKVQVYRICKK